jgi:predicted MFS family arabinose efflux permease
MDTPIPRSLTLVLAASCACAVANLYYAQPLAGPIGAELGLPPAAAGLVVTLTQVGYGLGLVLLAPMGDLVENRRLIVSLIGACAVALAVAATVGQAPLFLAAMLAVGATSVAVQVLVPYAAHLAPVAQQGRVVGDVMSGLMLGIMLARPVAGFVAGAGSWRLVFAGSSLLMVAVAATLWRLLPDRRPVEPPAYGTLLGSMVALFASTPVLRRRALYQAGLFGAFSLFWTTVPLLLAAPPWSLSQTRIALFTLAGVAGALAAPLEGRWADRGWSRALTAGALVTGVLSFGVGSLGTPGSALSVAALLAAAIALDFAVSANLVVGQRAIFSLGAALRGRLNGLFIACFFVAGAVGSAAGGWAFAVGGWPLAAAVGAAMPLVSLVAFVGLDARTDARDERSRAG